MRSRTGCLTCRARKLKCDERKPQCSQCRKASRECRPSEGIVFRHQQNASMNKDDNGEAGSSGTLKGFYSYKNTFDKDHVWLDIPKHVTFIDNSDPYAEELEASLSTPDTTLSAPQPSAWSPIGPTGIPSIETQTHGLDALSAAATRDTYSTPQSVQGAMSLDPSLRSNATYGHVDMSQSLNSIPSPNNNDRSRNNTMPPPPSSPTASMSPSNNKLNFILNPPASISPSVDPSLHSPDPRRDSPFAAASMPAHGTPGDTRSDSRAETEHEIAFLLRHFSEAPGQWMDLFDLGQYFGCYVPVKALTNPLLKYAACAYAAKQLARVKGVKAVAGGVCSKQASIEVWKDSHKVEWYYYAAKYYEKAIRLLMEALERDGQAPPLSNAEAFGQWQVAELYDSSDTTEKRRSIPNTRLSSANSDEVLAATAILSVYEFLDGTSTAWSGHLSGVKSLLDVAEVGMAPLEQRISPNGTHLPLPKRPGFSKARKATFWNFARQDYVAAFINECQSRLDTDNLALWTEAGLLIDSAGYVRPSNTTGTGYPEGDDVMREDMISNALIWLLSKVVNFLAVSDDLLQGGAGADRNHAPSILNVSQGALLEKWHHLQTELDAWYNGLPDTFKPCARLEPPRPGQESSPFQEVWYSIPMCASTMQHYHMARVLLLINKPHESTTGRGAVTNRLKSYRSIESKIRYHSYEICGISMARSDASVRIHAVQPLFISGQCLTDSRERRTILQLLQGIEADLGWATDYRMKQLLKEWDWGENSMAAES